MVLKIVKALVGRRMLPGMGALQDVSEVLKRSGCGSGRSACLPGCWSCGQSIRHWFEHPWR